MFDLSKAGNYGIVMKVDQDGGAGNGDYAMDRVAFQYISRDTDGDGICDDKDIDSDNDGITDNVEAQTTQDYIEPSGTDVDKDGLDDAYDKDTSNTSATASKGLTPVDTDRDSTADYIDRDSDNDGKLDIAERDDGASSITDATDTDHDGLLDIFEGTNANDGYDANDENVTENGFTLADSDDDLPADGDGAKPLVVDFDYRENAVLDRDGDGIIDTVDIDQDNDGVIDVTEGKDTSVEEKFDTTDIANDKIPDLDFNGTKVEVTSNTTEGSLTYGQESGAVNFEYSENNVATVSLATDAFVDFVIDSKNVPNSRQFDRYDQLTVSSPGAYIVVYDPDNVLNVAQGIYLNSLTFSVKGLGNLYGESWSVRVVDVKTVTLSMGWHPDYNVVANVGSCVRIGIGGLAKDTDRDNIADHLDIDSDNDGITDNVEAQTTQDYIKPTGTDVDKDGLDDAYDKDTSNITATASKGLTPVDTDGDNTVDYLDSDSDDDGKLDIAERDDGATSVSDSTDTDGDGLLDIFEGSDANDGFDANDENLVDGNFALSDSDNDIAADGSDASPPGFDLDYRDSIGPPTAVEDAGKTNEDVALVVTKDKGLLSNDTLAGATEIASAAIDTDGDGVADTALVLGQANTVKDSDGNVTGKLTLAKDGSYRFDPVANFFGALPIISYSLKGPGGYASSTLTITVTAVNDAPVVTNDKGDAKEDETLSVDKSEGLLANDSDVEGDSLVISGFSVAGVTGSFTAGEAASIPGKGTLTLNADGSYSFTPAPNYHGSVPEITYTVSDGKGGTSSGSLTITVASVEDSVSLGGLGDGSDGSDGSVNESALTGGSAAGGSGSVHTGSFTLGPASSLDSLTIGVTMITRAQLEASGTTAITITGSYGELSINGYDSDTGVVSYRYVLSSVADHGSDPVLDSFTIGTTDSDGDETYNAGTLAILVVDDVSTAKADQGSVDEDASGGSSLTGNVVSNDTLGADGAADSGALSAVGKGEAAPSGRVGSSIAGDYGSLVMDASGKYLYTLDNANATVNGLQKGQTLTETFTYQITDADGDTSTATLTITIKGANDAPTAEDITAKCAEDGETTGTIVGEDPDGDSLSFTLDAQPEGGTVTLDEDTGAFTFVPDANVNGDITFSVTVDDGHGGKTQVEVTVKISAVNDVPVASDDSASTAEDTPLIVGKDEGVLSNDSDIDGDALSVASFSVEGLTGTFTAGETATIAGVGTLTLNADGSYRFDPALNYHGSVPKVTYVLSDGHVSDTATLSITVDSVDDSVSVGGLGDGGDGVDGEVKESGLVDADGTGLTHDGTFTLGPADSLASFTLGGSTITLAQLEASATTPIKVTGSHGTLTIKGYDRQTGTLSYRYTLTSAADHSSGAVKDSFAIDVTDVEGDITKGIGTLSIRITDDAPSATADTGSVTEDGAASTGNVLSNDRQGADGSKVSKVGVAESTDGGSVGSALVGSFGTLTLNADGSYVYALDNTNAMVNALQQGETLTETYSYQIIDADGDTSTATLTITIKGANDAPTASVDALTTSEDTPVDGSIVAEDVDGDNLSFDLVAQPEGGTVSLSEDGSFTFTPDANVNGDITFSVTVSDGNGGTVTVEVSVTVTPVNDAPTVVDDKAETNEDTTLEVAKDKGVLANDTDVEGDSLSVSGFSVEGVTGSFKAGETATIAGVGTLTLNADGSYTFVPATNYNGSVPKVTYSVSDGNGGTSSGVLVIKVKPVDDEVSLGGLGDGNDGSDGNAMTDGSVKESGLTGGSDVAGGGISHSGSFTLGPADSLASLSIGTTSITRAQLEASATTPIKINGTHGLLTITGYDQKTGIVSYTFTLTTNASHGDGEVHESFVIGVTDVEGDVTASAGTLTIAVIDDAPVAKADTGQAVEDGGNISGSVIGNDLAGADGAPSKGLVNAVGRGKESPSGGVGSSVAGSYGSLILDANGNYLYKLDSTNTEVNALAVGASLTEVFTYQIIDADGDTSTATLTITIMGANDAPVASVDAISTPEDTPVSGKITASDVDGDSLSFDLVAQPDGGTVTLNENGTFTFTPDANVNGDVSFSVTVDDGHGGTTTVEVTVTVTPVNDIPVATPDTNSTSEDTPLVVNKDSGVLANDSDVDGDSLSVSGFTIEGVTGTFEPGETVAIEGVGKFTLNADGSYRFEPALNYHGDVPKISYSVSDGAGGTTTGTLQLSVEAVDDKVTVGGLGDGSGDGDGANDGQVSESGLAGGTGTLGSGVSHTGSFTLGPADSLASISLGGTTLTLDQLVNSAGTPIRIQGGHGELVINGYDKASGTVSYIYTLTAHADHSQGPVSDDFAIAVTDVDGDVTADAGTLSIAILDDAPKAVNDVDDTINKPNQPSSIADGNVLTGDGGDDPDAMDGDADLLGGDGGTVSAVGAGSDGPSASHIGQGLKGEYGTLVLNADGSYRYVPDFDSDTVKWLAAGRHVSDTFTYQITDPDGDTATATLTIRIYGTTAVVGTEGGEVDEAQLNTDGATGTDPGDAGEVIYEGSFSVVDRVTQQLKTLTIGDTSFTPSELAALSADNPSVRIETDHGYFEIIGYQQGDGTDVRENTVLYRFVLTEAAEHGGERVFDSVDVVMTDQLENSTRDCPKALMIEILDDAPIAAKDTASVAEDGDAGTGSVLTNDRQGADGDVTVTASGPGASVSSDGVGSEVVGKYGSLTLAADGSYTYTLDNTNTEVDSLKSGGSLTETFSYQITDADGSTSIATLTITIEGANDAPTASVDALTTQEDTPVSGTIEASDVEGDDLSFDLVAQPDGGKVTLNDDGTFTFTPDDNVNGDITFKVTVSDGNGGTTTVEVTVKVEAVNDLPKVTGETASTPEDTPLDSSSDDSLPGLLDNDSDIETDHDSLVVVDVRVDGMSESIDVGETVTIDGVGKLTVEADGAWRFEPALNYHGKVPTITYTVSDGEGGTSTATLDITVTPVDDQVNLGGLGDGNDGGEGGNISDGSVSEAGLPGGSDEGSGLSHSGSFTLGPADSLASFTLGSRSISLAELEASASSPIAIEGRYGTLTIEGYDRATGTVSYRYLLTSNADHANEPVSDDFMISVTDVEGEVTANAGTLVIDIDDDSPSATDDSGTVDEDGAAGAGSVWANDRPGADGADANGAVVGVGVEAGSLDGATGVPLEGSYGSLILNADGSYSYTLDNTNGEVDELQVGGILTEKFRYQIRDADGDLATATLTITIRGANDAPEASAEKVTASEDTPVDGKIIATDVDDDELTFSLDAQPEGGTVTLDEEGNFTFTPDANFNGDTSFTVTATDPSGATVTVEVDVSVTPVNDAPSAKNDQATIAEDTPLTVAAEDGLLANDSDIEGDSLSVTGFSVDGIEGTFLAGQTAVIEGVGELTISANGSYRFVPALNYNGEVPLVTYTVSDDGGATSDASLSISVTAVDDKVTVGGLGDGGGEPGGGDSAGDATTDGSVDEAGLTGGSHEGLGLSHSGTFTLGPADSLSSLTLGGSTISLDQLKDCGSHPIEVTGDHGTLVLRYYDPATGEVSYTYHLASRADHSGGAVNDSFAIGVTDVEGETTDNIGTLAIAIIDDGPGTGNDRGEVSEEGSEPGSDCSGNVLLNDHYGVDGVAVDGGVTAVGSGQSSPEGGVGEPVEGRYGSLVLNADGSYSYTLDNSNPVVDALKPGQTLTETFSYTITDSDGSVSTATLTISVLGANDAPVASVDPIVTTEDTPVEGRVVATDVDNDDLTFRLDHQPDGGTVTLNEDGTFTFVPDPDVSGDISFSVTVTDASGATTTVVVTVSVEPVNDVPVASADPIVTGSGEAAAGQVVASDVEGDDLTFALDDGPRHGQLTLNPDGSFIYVPEAGFFGSDSFVVAVSDGQGGVTYVTVSVTVEPLDSLYIGDRAPEVPAQDVESDAEGPLMHADGMVDEVVNQYGGLGGLADLSTDGAVRAAVHGISALTDAEMEVVNKDQPRESSAWNSSMLQEARSLAHPGEVRATSWASSDGRATLEALVENERAWLTLPEGQRDIKVSLPGGRALPDWIQRPSIGQLLIERPAALEKVTLDIDSRGGEGEAHHYRLVLDLDKVRLEVSESEPSSPVAAPGFSEQLSRTHHRSNDLDPNLLEALALLTEHD
ncbi:Ig-like domain-containing protein [Halomonas sp. YLB-10]|uniref:Ig-like domain-containing protein n=3 Tax=unclassified Halomonas TaxID=2609666 RepID=UPI001639BF17|nr:Ig-like domain-containing protein [Halomonas sp. YLB-10]